MRGVLNSFFALMLALAASLAIGQRAHAEAAPFDLAGPELRISVSRGGQTLPITRTPALAAGDQLTIKAELPPGPSAH